MRMYFSFGFVWNCVELGWRKGVVMFEKYNEGVIFLHSWRGDLLECFMQYVVYRGIYCTVHLQVVLFRMKNICFCS